MTTRLLLIRHGETNATAADRFSGEANVHLTDTGRQQVELLARRLAPLELAAIYSSPSERALETAKILAQPHGLTPVPSGGLQEISVGHWEGLSYAEVRERYPAELAAWEADPITAAPEGAEPGINVLARALPTLRQIVVDYDEKTVAVVSHSGTLRMLLSSLLGFDPRDYRRHLSLAPASLSILDFKDKVHALLVLYNDISHYGSQP